MTLAAQQTLMWSDLSVASDERRDLSSLVQPGNRAVSVVAQQNDKSYALIHAGDYVDLISTMQATKDPAADARTAVVLLQKVLVLAVGLDTEPRVDREGQNKEQLYDLLSVNRARIDNIEKQARWERVRGPAELQVRHIVPSSSACLEQQADEWAGQAA